MGVRVSAVGWVVAVLAVAGLVAGRLLGWGELAGLGVVGAVVLGAGAAMSFGRSRFEVQLDLADHRVHVGQRALGRLVVVNAGSHRSLGARLEVPVGPVTAELALPSLAASAGWEEVFAVPTAHRGVVVVGPVRVRRGDPFGLVSRGRVWTQSVELFIHPRVVTFGAARAGLLRDLEGQATRDLSDSDMSFHALRDYVAGDDRRMIHWRTSARVGTLMVRQFEDTRRTRTTVALATADRDFADDEEFELAVAVAASLAVHVVREERELTFLAGARRIGPRTPAALLDDCCRITREQDGDRALDLPQRIAAEPPTSSVAFLVVGSRTSLAELRPALRHVPTGMRVVALRCAPGEPVQVQRQGLVSLASLGALDDLPALVRRVDS
ncbi:DUF58 domain-containing protein [Cellulomonas citrea]|uniref:DUF58 domain-containing protein n=1 Tax=Cellulomonas citrea TaxID=1909423 RepID=UPI0013577387|nr:DUF58 domain-containing protein [Cellulomonas citrea]